MRLEEGFKKFLQAYKLEEQPVKNPEETRDTPMFRMRINGENGDFDGVALCVEDERLFVFYAGMHMRVPEEKRDQISRLLLDINYDLKVGNFLIIPESGEIAVRVTQYIYGTDWEQTGLIERAVLICGKLADSYYWEIIKAIP